MKVKVGKSEIQGKGLLVKKAIREGELIGLAHVNDQPATIIGKYHNHSENPSAASMKIGNKRYLVALRELKPGEEITTDYRQQPELEQPEDFKKGGLVQMPKNTKKGLASKAYTRSIEGTNRVFTENKLFERPKDRKRRIFDPRAKHYAEGGEPELPKAQLGKGMTVEVDPFSLNANQTQLASNVAGEYTPEMLLGLQTPLGGSKDPNFTSTLGLTAGFPYSGPFVPSVNADWHWRFRPSALTAGAFAPTVHTDVTAGWDPTQGFNAGLQANPRWEFGNYNSSRYRTQRWPVGAWRSYVGPSAGVNLRQNTFIPEATPEDLSEGHMGNIGLNYGAAAGFEARPFKSTPLRMGVDASLLFQPGKSDAEQAFNPETDFGTVGWGATPMVKAKVVYPIGLQHPKKDKVADIEKLKEIDRNTFDNVIDEASLTPIDIDLSRKKKKDKDVPEVMQYEGWPGFLPTGEGILPLGYLPGYSPETGREVPENFTMERYGFDDEAKIYQNGGEQDAMNAMMKARLAYANEFKNPAAQRMIVLPDNPYDFGNGMTGTHYMASMDNYAVPQIQNQNGQLVLGNYEPNSNEAIQFDRPEDAEYFAEHYKDVSPGFIEAELTPEEIEEYRQGGWIVEDVV